MAMRCSCSYVAIMVQSPCPNCGSMVSSWEEIEDPVRDRESSSDEACIDGTEDPTWSCMRCDARNPARLSGCEACGTARPAFGWVMVCGPERVDLSPGVEILLGRSQSSPLARLFQDHTVVSREHCRVVVAVDGRLTITDIGSSNGSWLEDGDNTIQLNPRISRTVDSSVARIWLGGEPGDTLAYMVAFSLDSGGGQ